MNLQKYRKHGVERQLPRLLWGPRDDGRSWRVRSHGQLFQRWIAGILLGGVIGLVLWDLVETRGSRLSAVQPLLVLVSLTLAFNAFYWAPRPGEKPDSAEDEDVLDTH